MVGLKIHNTKNVNMYDECNSLTSKHKITLDGQQSIKMNESINQILQKMNLNFEIQHTSRISLYFLEAKILLSG